MRRAAPSTNRENGRGSNGRFQPGWKGGPGNPLNQRACELRSAMMEAVSRADVRAIMAALVEAAKAGDTIAAREILNRTIGTPGQADLLQRIEALETSIEERYGQS